MLRSFSILFGFTLCLTACSSGSDYGSSPAATDFTYKHTRAFLTAEINAQLEREWKDPAPDAETGAIVTAWREQLAVMSRFGRRDRLRVSIEGTDGAGWKVRCDQESQRNMEQEDPLNSEKADWESLQTDAALAKKFLFDLHRRLNPKQEWREADIR
jgi:hypothetical protein